MSDAKECRWCGKIFSKTEVPERYCSKKCAMKAAGVMKTVALFLAFLVFFAVNASAQTCPPMPVGLVCVPQATIDRAANAADELLAARDALAKFAVERATAQAEREAANQLILRLNAVIAVQDRMTVEYQKVVDLYKAVVQMQQDLIEKLTQKAMASKSGWAKFFDVLKTVASIATGILIGRGL